jgi:hypothetical protein
MIVPWRKTSCILFGALNGQAKTLTNVMRIVMTTVIYIGGKIRRMRFTNILPSTIDLKRLRGVSVLG